MAGEPLDVLVIGAGAAGLHAAARLGRAGLKVELVEARDRVGGRIWSIRPQGWGSSIELGAEFVHGGNATLHAAMRNAGVRKTPVKEQHWLIHDNVRRSMPDAWDRIDHVMKKIGPRYRGSFGDWLLRNGDRLTPEDRMLAEKFVEGFQGAPLHLMSTRTLFEATKGDEAQFRPVGGYGRLVLSFERRLAATKIPLHLNRPINLIRWKRNIAEIYSGNTKWEARAVLVTVPLGVLRSRRGQAGHIRFSPEVTRRRKIWRSLPTGHALRIVLRMRSDLWRRGVVPPDMRARQGAAFGFLHSDERMFPVWWSKAPAPILVGWTGGPAAQALSSKSNELIFAEALRTLAKLLGCEEDSLRRAIVDWRVHDWLSDPMTRGAYAFSVAGREDAPRRLREPIEKTLFFAGEATADALELGTVHGALSSGDRAAEEIISVLKKRS
jgi:monoamine oxidase